MKPTVFTVVPLKSDESLSCYLLRVASSESLDGLYELTRSLGLGHSNAALNAKIGQIAAYSRQPHSSLIASRVCQAPSHPTLKEKFARLTSHPFCPACLREEGYFRRDWRHGLVTACAIHKCKLIDTCPSCETVIDFSRSNLLQCDCGQLLTEIAMSEADPRCVWVSTAIGRPEALGDDALKLGNHSPEDWRLFDEIVFLFGSYKQAEFNQVSKPRRTGKMGSMEEATDFVLNATVCLADFPTSFEEEVKSRLLRGDKTKAGFASRLGYWFREFRRLTAEGSPDLRAAFARSAANNFDGHDSKNAWIYEHAPARFVSITEAAATLGVKAARLKAMLINSDESEIPRENTFNTVSLALLERLKHHLAGALSQLDVLERTGLTESALKNFISVGALPKRRRPEWDLNHYKPFDLADIEALEGKVLRAIPARDGANHDTVNINSINKRMSTNKEVVLEVFEKIATGELLPVNVEKPGRLGDLLFSKADVSEIVGNSHEATKFPVERLSIHTGWKSESIRYWVQSGYLQGELGELRGQPTCWVSIEALCAFMRRYAVVSDLATQLKTSPKALTAELKKLGIPIVGAKHDPVAGASRGGLVERFRLLCTSLSQSQAGLFEQLEVPDTIP